MIKPKIHRKRLIPFETVDISGDELVYRSEELLITNWKTIKPRQDFASGVSYTFLKEGYKISKFIGHNGEFLYWYCDIIDVEYNADEDLYILEDLLLDVKLDSNGFLQVLDSDELAQAMEMELVSNSKACKALKILDRLLKMVYSGNFPPQICNG